MNIEGLKKGSYDLIFGSYSANEPNIEFIPIIKQDLVAILPIGHPLCKKDEIEAGDFQKYPVLGYARHSGLGKYTRNFFKEHGVLPNFICESPDENGIASLVAKDFGIALVADVDTIHRDDICIRPLISQETWDAVQRMDNHPARGRSGKSETIALFGGLLRCMDCGSSMRYIRDYRKRKSGESEYRAYACNRYMSGGKNACSSHYINQKMLA